MKKSCWFGLPPAAWPRRPVRARRAPGLTACCCFAFALTAARAIGGSEYRFLRGGLPPLHDGCEPDRAFEEEPERDDLDHRGDRVDARKRDADARDGEIADAPVASQ